MTTATWNGVVVAESDDIVTVEGNAYFPRDAVRDDVLRPSDHHTLCPWKGTASYYDLEVEGRVNKDAVWYYPDAQGRREGDHAAASRSGTASRSADAPGPGKTSREAREPDS